MKIKLCGFVDEKPLKVAIDHGCDFVGLVFVKKSPRFLSLDQAAKIAPIIPPNIAKVAVVANQNIDELKLIYDILKPQYFQLHGDEDIEYIRQVRNLNQQIKIIKALSITSLQDIKQTKIFENNVDFFLFDHKNAGSGTSFDWNFLNNLESKIPWFLSGGININNIEEALKKTKAQYIDISSGIEVIRGTKSAELIVAILKKFKSLGDSTA